MRSLLSAFFALTFYATAQTEKVRVLVVTGGHSHETSFYAMFEHMSGLNVTVDPHPTAYRGDMRKNYDVLVLYDFVDNVPDSQRDNLQAFLENGGKGLVVLHHAIADFTTWQWWYRDVVGGRYLLKPDGALPASTYKHDEEIRVQTVGQHPILHGIAEMHLVDETYKQMWISPKVQVLLKTDNPTSDGPVAWVSPYEKARVVYIQLGHGRESHEYIPFRNLVRNAILWAAGKLP